MPVTWRVSRSTFFSGDRASDFGRIKTIDVLKHPNGSSLLFHQRVGKTLRGKLSRAFAVKQTANPAICPVRNSVELRLSGLVGTSVNCPDNRESG